MGLVVQRIVVVQMRGMKKGDDQRRTKWDETVCCCTMHLHLVGRQLALVDSRVRVNAFVQKVCSLWLEDKKKQDDGSDHDNSSIFLRKLTIMNEKNSKSER